MFDKLKALEKQYELICARMEEPSTYSDPAVYAKYEREAREILFTLVFESEFHSGRAADEIYETARVERGFENYRYIKKGLRDIMSSRDKIAAVIEARAEGWKVSRMTPATRAILFVGVFY